MSLRGDVVPQSHQTPQVFQKTLLLCHRDTIAHIIDTGSDKRLLELTVHFNRSKLCIIHRESQQIILNIFFWKWKELDSLMGMTDFVPE